MGERRFDDDFDDNFDDDYDDFIAPEHYFGRDYLNMPFPDDDYLGCDDFGVPIFDDEGYDLGLDDYVDAIPDDFDDDFDDDFIGAEYEYVPSDWHIANPR